MYSKISKPTFDFPILDLPVFPKIVPRIIEEQAPQKRSGKKKKSPNSKTSEAILLLDSFVDRIQRYSTLLEMAENKDHIRQLEKIRNQALEDLTQHLEPYLAKYVLLFSGRLPTSKWTHDTFEFLYLVSGVRSRRPQDYESHLNRIRFIAREFCVSFTNDSTLREEDAYSPTDIQATDLYMKLLEITYTFVLKKYQPRFKKETGERINFLYPFQCHLRFQLKHWITTLGKDYFNWKIPEHHEEEWQEDSTSRNSSSHTHENPSISSFEDFVNNDSDLWATLSEQERTILWSRVINKESATSLAKRLNMSTANLNFIYDSIVSEMRRIIRFKYPTYYKSIERKEALSLLPEDVSPNEKD